ncbi:23S rRNA (guanosine(2251)-2'-O)-methyltransferase RlmB [Facilibium subflavum]|uniref:23S rRNA (guanosine(2251)-2'-O)-methyltransferase RlmB n=1 Tax=Facilibium subflavum TaxID=2219058 RepID=UPI000E655EF5|nr:23S rRNA (guanosine(2251)-2'-O)-methyltransferase RlmB [Facilibium subflavum]
MSELLYGIHAIKARIKVYPQGIQSLYCIKDRANTPKVKPLIQDAQKKSVVVKLLSKVQFNELLQAHNIDVSVVHQGVLALCSSDVRLYETADLPELLHETKATPFILILDGVQDPHNFGACIRSADAAGVDFIVFPKDKNASVNATVQKVACGAAQSVKLVAATNLSRAIKTLQSEGVWIIGMAGEADSYLYSLDLKAPTAIIVGAEGSGMRHGTRSACDFLAKLPMYGEVSSLNVSVAAGIAMYELIRQRAFSSAI